MDKCDVLVVGGGPGGVPAAAAAARMGARAVLVEHYGFLGGMATAGLVNPYMDYWAGRRQLSRGIFAEIIDRLDNAGGLGSDRVTFDEEILKVVLDDLVRESNVRVLFHTTFVTCSASGGTIKGARFASKGGSFEIESAIYVDATGDGDLAAAAGARVEIGRKEDGLCQPMTLCFRIAGINRKALPESHREMAKALSEVYLAAKEEGAIHNPRENILVFKTLRDDVLHFNTTRVTGKSALRPETLSEAEFEGRRQTMELVRLFRAKAPGFENSYLQKMAAQIGVRESRRVIGEYVLQADDVVSARKFGDAIACSSYPVDIHNPAGTGTVIKPVPEGDWYEIPYRAIVPTGTANLVMATRAISSTHEAHSSLRVMPVVAAIGQAAGTAAAMAAAGGIRPALIDVKKLRATLRKAGAFIGDGE
jgi:hypothetical protein